MRGAWVISGVALGAMSAGAAAQETTTYSYDVHGRLTGVAHVNTSGPDATSTYVYDPADNRANRTITVAASLGANEATPPPPAAPPSEAIQADDAPDPTCQSQPTSEPADPSIGQFSDACE